MVVLCIKGRPLGSTIMQMSDIDKVATLTAEGKFRPEIAKALGVSETTVYKWQKKLNLV
jgi:DNA invertase Pin-like site-specific DNA recombinase